MMMVHDDGVDDHDDDGVMMMVMMSIRMRMMRMMIMMAMIMVMMRMPPRCLSQNSTCDGVRLEGVESEAARRIVVRFCQVCAYSQVLIEVIC